MQSIEEVVALATTKQKQAARKNLEKARAAGTKRKKHAKSSKGNALSTAEKDDLPAKVFAFPEERKEPLNDAEHVRNAIARFDQVEGVSDAARERAWKRIRKAAKKYDIEIEADSWRDLMKGGKAGAGQKAGKTKAGKAKAGTKSKTKSRKKTGKTNKTSSRSKAA